VDYATFVPGPVFETTDALARHLRDGPFDTERVRRFASESFDVADGRASQRFVDEVVVPAMEDGLPVSSGSAPVALHVRDGD
jgi:CDP-ribitol ribitolphosphotransferase